MAESPADTVLWSCRRDLTFLRIPFAGHTRHGPTAVKGRQCQACRSPADGDCPGQG